MNFSIKEVDEVIERTGCSYREAKEALLEADGDVVDAVILLEKDNQSPFTRSFNEFADRSERTAESVVEKIKEVIEKGNASKLAVRNERGETLASVSLNTGAAIGGVALLAGAAPLLIISALVARYGLNYRFVVIKEDGSETTI